MPPVVPPPDRLPMVSLLLSWKVAPEVFARVTSPLLAMAAPPLTARVPPKIVVVPVYVLVPERVSSPGPNLSSVVAVLLMMFEEIVSPPSVLFCQIARGLLAAPVSVPPLMVERLAPTPVPTRIPPEVITLAPVSDSVLAALELKRTLLLVMPAVSVPALLSTSMFPPV